MVEIIKDFIFQSMTSICPLDNREFLPSYWSFDLQKPILPQLCVINHWLH